MTALTEQHLDQYRRTGYALVPGLIPAELLARMRRRVLEIIADPTAWPAASFHWLDPSRYRQDNGLAIAGGVQRPALQEALFAEFVRHPALVAAMRRLLGGEVELFTDQIGYRCREIREEQGSRSYYHQDSYYWQIPPERGCNCWLPLDPVDRNAGALPIMPDSHRQWQLVAHESYYDDPPYGHADGHRGEGFKPLIRHRIPAALIDYSRETLHVMQPGDALFFTNYTWHRSEPNRTGADQLFYAIAYQHTDQSPA